jgi:hypothetical protein
MSRYGLLLGDVAISAAATVLHHQHSSRQLPQRHHSAQRSSRLAVTIGLKVGCY